jgi:quinol monooxygenase YgiN
MSLVAIGLNHSTVLASDEELQRALIAYMKVKPGTESQFLEAANEVIDESRAESGNIIYNLHQSVTNPQQFVFYELFKTDADLQYHRNARHVKKFLRTVDPIVVPGKFILEEYKYYPAP